MKSANTAAIDLENSVEQSPWNQKDLAVKASFSKLKRDFERARKTHICSVAKYHAKQRSEAALLSSSPHRVESPLERTVSPRQQRAVMDEVRIESFGVKLGDGSVLYLTLLFVLRLGLSQEKVEELTALRG